MRMNDYGTWNWNSETRQKATGFSYQVSSFNFFIAISVTMRHTLRSVTVKLQHRSLDIISAYEQINAVQMNLSFSELILMRNFMLC